MEPIRKWSPHCMFANGCQVISYLNLKDKLLAIIFVTYNYIKTMAKFHICYLHRKAMVPLFLYFTLPRRHVAILRLLEIELKISSPIIKFLI